MSEKEKQAIDILIDLYDKQQKELQELKWQNINKCKFDSDTFAETIKRDYISKDKIKDKIQELERLNKEQKIPVLKEYKFIRKEMIKYFEELIGEK